MLKQAFVRAGMFTFAGAMWAFAGQQVSKYSPIGSVAQFPAQTVTQSVQTIPELNFAMTVIVGAAIAFVLWQIVAFSQSSPLSVKSAKKFFKKKDNFDKATVYISAIIVIMVFGLSVYDLSNSSYMGANLRATALLKHDTTIESTQNGFRMLLPSTRQISGFHEWYGNHIFEGNFLIRTHRVGGTALPYTLDLVDRETGQIIHSEAGLFENLQDHKMYLGHFIYRDDDGISDAYTLRVRGSNFDDVEMPFLRHAIKLKPYSFSGDLPAQTMEAGIFDPICLPDYAGCFVLDAAHATTEWRNTAKASCLAMCCGQYIQEVANFVDYSNYFGNGAGVHYAFVYQCGSTPQQTCLQENAYCLGSSKPCCSGYTCSLSGYCVPLGSCDNDYDCRDTEECKSGQCSVISEPVCGFVSNHKQVFYDCCEDSDCAVGEACSNHQCSATPTKCGDGQCERNLGESEITCPTDCAFTITCGDGICNQLQGETVLNCPQDCGGGYTDSDGDGIDDTLDACPNTPPIEGKEIGENGCYVVESQLDTLTVLGIITVIIIAGMGIYVTSQK